MCLIEELAIGDKVSLTQLVIKIRDNHGVIRKMR